MKKILTALFVFAVFASAAPSAHAYFIDENGQTVAGFDRRFKAQPGPEQAFVVEETRAAEYTPPTFGNTTIQDVAARLKAYYRDLFLYMAEDSGIRF